MDVFVSYARSTEALAISIEEALRALGYSVWRDDQLPAHRAYAQVIEERLNAAKAVLVVWSAEAIASQWVRSEANRARKQHKLVQASVGRIDLPMPFDQLQRADLSGWAPGSEGPGWRKIVASLGELVGPPTGSPLIGAPLPPITAATDLRPVADKTNLPNASSPMIGRDAEAMAISAALAAASLVTIVGPGGVGKTRISLEVARSQLEVCEDGVWLVELAGVADSQQLPERVANAMNLELPVGSDARAALIDRLRRRHCLLLIDNCEHLVYAVAEFAEAVVSQAPGVKLLMTSQEPLGIAAEQVYRLQPLANPQAVALFNERARACDPAFAADPGDAEAIAAICRRLDGVPLAVEMAAARAPSLGCAAVLQRLDDRFRILTGGRRTAMPRQRTLQATLDWSHSLLSERDATIFRRLSVFAGSFTLDAASEIAADAAFDSIEVIDAVSSLVAKSLLTVKPAYGRTRNLLLETTRAYAFDKLTAAGELDTLQRRHATWCEAYAQPFWPDFIDRLSDVEVLARQTPEVENINRALDWAFGPDGDIDLGHRLLAASTVRLDDRALQRRHEVAHPLIGSSTAPAVRAWLLASRAHIAMVLSPRSALPLVDEAIEAVRAHVPDPVKLVDTLATKAYALWAVGRFAEARPIADEMKALMADQPASRIKAFQLAVEACLRVVEIGPEAGAPLFEEAISSTLAFGAHGTATSWQRMKLRLIPPGDPNVEIREWRRLLKSIGPADMYAEPQMLSVAKELARRLARRGTPDDLNEALQLARLIFKAGPGAADRGFVLTMAMVAVSSGRLEGGAGLVGYLGDRPLPLTEPRAVADHEAVRANLRQRLGEPEFEALAAIGARMAKGEIIRLALGELPSEHALNPA